MTPLKHIQSGSWKVRVNFTAAGEGSFGKRLCNSEEYHKTQGSCRFVSHYSFPPTATIQPAAQNCFSAFHNTREQPTPCHDLSQ